MDSILKLDGKAKKKALWRKSLNVNGRGRKSIDSTTRTEIALSTWLEEWWRLRSMCHK